MSILDYYQFTQMNMKKMSLISMNEYSKLFYPTLANNFEIGLLLNNWLISTQLPNSAQKKTTKDNKKTYV